ncbi:MAG: histidine kinase [Desulfuromonadales bacterium]|nr:MAG: histidine kinase [Desulfuromonadales bacterium]
MKKKLLAVAAAGALTAATAVPALALENEFHGMFRLFGTVANYGQSNSSTGATSGSTLTAPELADNAPTRNFVEQRARLMYIAKANDDLKLVTHFEIDSRWGDSSYTNGRNVGGAIGADTVDIETKNVYLDFNIPSTPMNFKVGIQPFIDSYGGIFVNADIAGAQAIAKYAGFTNTLGFFRFTEAVGTLPGKADRDLFVADVKYDITKDIKLGGSYYLMHSDLVVTPGVGNPNAYTHMVGLNSSMKFDPVTLNVFGLYQFGDNPGPISSSNTGNAINTPATRNSKVDAYALGATAKAKLGPGTLKLAGIYVSGEQQTPAGAAGKDTGAFQAVAGESNFFAADMYILLRNKYNINSDRALVHTVSNVTGGFIGYDANITSKLFANVNVGAAWAAQVTNKGTASEPDSNYLGTELNAEVGYRLFDNMTASVLGAYVILGDFYQKTKGGTDNNFDDPYRASLMLNYAF